MWKKEKINIEDLREANRRLEKENFSLQKENQMKVHNNEKLSLNFEQEKFRLNLEIEKLKNEIKELKSLETYKNSLENKKLQEEIKELKNSTDKYKIQDLEMQLELSNKEITYKDRLIKRYMELPDIRKMLDGIQDLKVPAINDIKSLFETFKDNSLFNEMSKLETAINRIVDWVSRNNGRV